MSSGEKVTVNTRGEREVVITRGFDATPSLVFDALTKPELLRRWYGPDGWTLAVCEIDLRVGGKWHFVSRRPDGKEIGQLGVYQDIQRPERIVNTESWEDWDAGETLVTTELSDRNGKTTFTSTILFPSQEVRDTVLKSGLKHGVEASYDKLGGVLASIAENIK